MVGSCEGGDSDCGSGCGGGDGFGCIKAKEGPKERLLGFRV